jgi:hypothetical protein
MKSTLITALLCLAAMAAGTTALIAANTDPAPPPRAADPRPVPPDAQRPAPTDLSGTIASLNYGPRGSVEGFLLTTADNTLTQINLPAPFENTLALAPGDTVKVSAIPDLGPPPPRPGDGPRGDDNRPAPPPPDLQPTHPVLRAVALTDAHGKQITEPGLAPSAPVHVEAAVKTLNYDRRGLLNGAMLDSGQLVRIDPHTALALDLTAGKKLTIDGMSEKTPAGLDAIRAQTVNGTQVHMPPPPPGPDAMNAPRPPRPDDNATPLPPQ